MSLIRYERWNVLSQLQDEINRMFNNVVSADSSGATASWVPPVDITEFSDRFDLTVDLPGVDPDKVEITLEDGVLTLSGERPDITTAANGEELVRTRVERGHGRFYRRFVLPDTADAERVKATGKNGLLSISIPKQARALPRRIKVTRAQFLTRQAAVGDSPPAARPAAIRRGPSSRPSLPRLR